MSSHYVGRIAPSPTGAQHLGNARTYLVAWLLAQVHRGDLLLRIEDLDTPRTKHGATEQIFADLDWMGLSWNSTQILGESTSPASGEWTSIHPDYPSNFVVQSKRITRYLEILSNLKAAELVYPCTCTRKEIEESSSAPHESTLLKDRCQRGTESDDATKWSRSISRSIPIDGLIYPGTCEHLTVSDAEHFDRQGIKYAWRFRLPVGEVTWQDTFAGIQTLNPKVELGDFVVARNYGPPAYQLAVVVDDHDSGVTEVVRGDDLIYSTYRQLAIYNALGWSAPNWFHVPLVVGEDGKRLAKRHGDTRLSSLKEAGMHSTDLLGMLAESLGIIHERRPVDAVELKSIVLANPDLLKRIPNQAVKIPLGPDYQLP